MASRFCRAATPALLLCLLTAACTDTRQTQPIRFYALGTIIEVTLPDLQATKKAAIEKQLITSFQHWQTHWHPWQGDDSGLAAVNASLAETGRATVDTEIHDLIQSARRYHDQSRGLFDPAIGGLVKRWGFHQEDLPASPPSASSLDRWLQDRPHYDDLELRDSTVVTTHNGLQLDFGGYAKGYALDQAAALLKRQAIDNALINAGGDLTVLGNAGSQGDARPWHIGIRHPRRGDVLAGVELQNGESLVTSGDYERYFMADDKRYHHILDPRTARPATDTIAVSVIHQNAARADAAATALFVAGPGSWRETAADMQTDCAMLIDANGNIHTTECMQQRLEFNIDPEQGIQVTP